MQMIKMRSRRKRRIRKRRIKGGEVERKREKTTVFTREKEIEENTL